MTRLLTGCLAATVIGAATPVFAQALQASDREPLQLATLQRQARDADARTREIELLAQQTDLRLRSIDVERLPSVSALGQSQYQSDVVHAPFNGPDGQAGPLSRGRPRRARRGRSEQASSRSAALRRRPEVRWTPHP